MQCFIQFIIGSRIYVKLTLFVDTKSTSLIAFVEKSYSLPQARKFDFSHLTNERSGNYRILARTPKSGVHVPSSPAKQRNPTAIKNWITLMIGFYLHRLYKGEWIISWDNIDVILALSGTAVDAVAPSEPGFHIIWHI